MITQYGKRVLSFLLAVIMVFSAVPVQVFAEELQDGQDEGVVVTSELMEPVDEVPEEIPEEVVEEIPEEPDEEVPVEIIEELVVTETVAAEQVVEPADLENEAVSEIQATIDEMLTYYLGTTTATVEEIEAAVDAMDSDTIWMAQVEIYDLEEKISETLTEAEAEALVESNTVMCDFSAILGKYHAGPNLLAETTILDGEIKVYSNLGSIAVSGNTVTITNKISGMSFGTSYQFVITNTSGKSGTLQFDYNGNTFDSFGLSSKTGTYPATLLKDGDQITITASSWCSFGGQSDKLILSNIVFTPQKDGYETEFVFDASLGSVTVDGNTVASGDKMQIMAKGATLATTNSNFLGWIDDNSGKILSTAKSFLYEPTDALTVRPVFTSSDPWFQVNKQDGNYLFKEWEVATAAAAGATNKAFVLANSGTLPAGDYTIPSGVTLLIPYNDANTLYTTAPGTQDDLGYSEPKVYRKLTMAEGANITINGAMSLSAMTTSSGGQSAPVGNCSFVQMDSGSTITVNNGGNLYAWGYIQGSGSVTVENGGTVYECFQLMDWRGGDNTSGMIGNSQRVFPMSQYYVQNIEVPLTLKQGATENGYMSVQISWPVGIQGSDIPFIGSNGMFNIESGHIVKDYDESTGRLLIDMHGNLSVKSLSLSMKLSVLGTKTINSKEYILPINGNMTVTMYTGSAVTMTQDIALQPGAKMIIEEGATCTLGNGNKIYIYDYDQWTTEVAADAVQEGPSFCGTPDATHINLKYPASAKNVYGRTDDAYVKVNGTVDASAGFVYTTSSGANVRGTGTIIMKPGTDTVTYQVKNTGSDNKTDKWVEIPITSAQLQNADKTVTNTSNDKGVVTYKSVNGIWTCEHSYAAGTFVEEVTIAATCLEAGVKTITCNCGEDSYTEEISALGHAYEAVVTAPTCTEAGYTTHICKNDASHNYTDTPVAALGHDEVPHEAKAPTCTDAGWDAYVTCSRCDYTTYVEKEALGHSEEVLEAKAPTCTATGLTEGKKCTVCGETTVAQNEVPALGHSEEVLEAKAPTCTATGLTEGKKCTVCGETTVAQTKVPALGHKEQTLEAKAPTCTATGLTEGKKCTVCGETTVAQNEVPALGHTEEVLEAKAPTCTATGLTEGKKCTVCGETTVAQNEVPALGHKEVVDKAVAATCTATGLTEGKHCSVCNTVTVAQNKVAALGHKWAWVTDKEATVLEPGVKHEECSVCHEKRYENTEIPVLACAHTGTMTITEAKAASCTDEGNTRYSYCSACQNYYSDDAGQHEIEKDSWITAALGHAEVPHDAKAPTCTEIGWDAYVTCSRFGCDYTTKVEKEALDHDKIPHEAKAPTCTEIGWDAYETCSRCDYTTYVEKAALKHDKIPHEAKAPTCTEIGWDAYETCSRCDYTTYVEKTALGHAEVPHDAKAPTCTEIGWDAYVTCSRCDYTTYVEKAALDHDKVANDAKAPTCTEIGWDAYETCSRCDYSSKVEIPAKGHAEKLTAVEAVAATCQKEGIVAHWSCPDCKMTFADESGKNVLESVVAPIDPNNHAFAEEGEKTAATCKAEGKIVYPCKNEGCKETKTETLPVDPEGHVWNEGTPFGNHSCNSASYLIYKCTLCEKENKVVDEEQHFRVPIAEEIPATCTEDGMTSGWKCEKCDEFWVPQEVIPALGHDWNGNVPCQSETSACTRCDLHFDSKQECKRVEVAGYPATCTEPGLTDGAYCEYCGEVIVAQTEISVADHAWIKAEQEVPATCNSVGHYAGASYCMDCDYDENAIPMLEHEWMHREAKKATYSAIGWNAHDYCLLCNATRTLEQYEGAPCEFCGENPEIYTEIPKVEIQSNETLEEFITNIGYLEMMAEQYAKEHPGTDPLGLVLNYLRTAVENYTSGSWAIMAGPEDKDFLKYVQEAEDTINANPDIEVWVNVSGLKKLKSYANTHGEINEYSGNLAKVMTGHFFGTMDMTYHNKGSQNHADVGGWVGDLTDLLSTTDEHGVPANLTLEEKITYIRDKYLFKTNVSGSAGSFGHEDLYADLEGFYFMNELITNGYNTGDLAAMMREYFQPGLTLEQRVAYLLNNRLDGLSTRQDLRTAVYNAYTSNKLIATLEGTRNFNASGNELAELRKAVCYAFADEMCRIAGDYVEDLTNDRFTIFDTETKILAPGISQQINYATNADGKQIVYYVATADVTRDDVGMWVNYYDRDPGTPENPVWKNNSVPSSAQNAQDRYGDPASEDYIENFNVIASTNAGGYDMSDTATPGGLVVMNGVEWYPQTNTAGFFAILADGTAYMGTHDQYEGMMAEGKIQEAIGGFGEFVVKDGVVVGNATYSDAPRTSVGITATGRVVVMCIDGRQAPFSSGASLRDVGYIMKEAGCVIAINLDGGGSTTFVARQPGSDELTVMNRPSDGYPRNVSTNLLIYSTAPSSTKFDHAVIESEYDYATINTPVQMTAAGVSPAGNAVDIPEGATWAVSDENWGSITEDGVFTGKRLGEVRVDLMLDGVQIGSKLMELTKPDQLYFERAKVDAIYGSSVKLPLRARVGGKAIAINPNDVAFTLSAPTAGSMDGFTFLAAESATKSLSITAAIGEDIKASINVMLYKQGENSFDFDKATGGDRTLAWHREVSNSKLEDSNIYNVIDPAKDMVTSYTFAMDMTTIPIPERISELTYMLPGGTMEGATAWSFLLSLAQRISDMSWVKATIDFDDRFNVDYNDLEIKNEYFEMKALEFDETTNTLSVTMSWIKQSQVIDEATANPLCLINGLKLTPKAGVWEDVSKINAVTSGNISYEIYMRASGLYGFAQKPENQAVFGIYPYRNPADTSDAGGYFRDTYAEITDEYTLVNVVKEGWVNEEGGFAYYVDGERLTGVQKVEGFYYDFGEKGVNVGQTKFTGLFYAEEAKAYRYSYLGEIATGWQMINSEWYYFSNGTTNAVSGTKKVGDVYYDFEENGKLVSGVWAHTLDGVRYYYGPSYYEKHWAEIDGKMYYFKNSYVLTGYQKVRDMENGSIQKWYDLGDDGACRGKLDGLLEINDALYYIIDGVSQVGLHCVEGDYYFFTYAGPAVKNTEYYAWETHCDLPCSNYAFGEDGKMANSLVQMSDGIYYYFNGKVKTNAAGITKIDEDYYFVSAVGRVATGKYYCWATNCELPCGEYEFGADGKMLQGIVEKADGTYYFVNGKPNGKHAGITKVGSDYYFVASNGRCATGKYYCWATNCELTCGEYEFGADGKMLQGIVEKADGYYYYINGRTNSKYSGLTKVGDDYYFVASNGKCATGIYYAWATNCDLPCGNYEFGADGKMVQGVVVTDSGIYYYTNGNKGGTQAGLTKVGDDYYFVASNGRCATGSYYCWATNCDLPNGTYEFGADGKMLHGLIEKEDGIYSYVYGKLGGNAGLIKLDDGYYFVANNGKVATGKYNCWKTLCDLPTGTYEFGPDGKMYDGFITKDDGIYYYVKGKIGPVGLMYLDGYYYFVSTTGRIVTNQRFFVWKTNGLLLEKEYNFNELGQITG